jgi:3-oxoacyl-[acyl-carrier-protein] synthase II
MTIDKKTIPPTINYENPAPDCDLDYVPNEARRKKVDSAMAYSLGAGGNNASLVLAHC